MLDPLFVGLSLIGSFGAVWIALGLLVALVRRLPFTFVIVTAGVLTADSLATLLKDAVGRRRPFIVDPDQDPIVSTPASMAFPSGHAATSFAGATLLAWYAPRAAVPLYLLAALVAWSRVYGGVHYPLDILAGAALGIAVAIALRWLVAALQRSRRAPPQG